MATNETGKHVSFINRSVAVATQFKMAYDQWAAIRAEWDALDYVHQITDADFTTVNTYLDAAELQAFYTSQANLAAFWTAGNGTNICNMLP